MINISRSHEIMYLIQLWTLQVRVRMSIFMNFIHFCYIEVTLYFWLCVRTPWRKMFKTGQLCIHSHHVSMDINLNYTCTTVSQIGTGMGKKTGMFIPYRNLHTQSIFHCLLLVYINNLQWNLPSNCHNVLTWNEKEIDFICYWSTTTLQ